MKRSFFLLAFVCLGFMGFAAQPVVNENAPKTITETGNEGPEVRIRVLIADGALGVQLVDDGKPCITVEVTILNGSSVSYNNTFSDCP
ncbi:MAG: hypothetical protein IPM36_03230 [Lewinellaceae bacterium]|nr:hypothetical protein [Lewinellaceae bacterium]